MMYEELVKRLRNCATEAPTCNTCDLATDGFCCDTLMVQAANAIAELSKKRVGTWHRFKATQRSYSFVCNSCGSMYPYLTRCCPNCGVEYIDEEPPKEETW